MQKIINKLAGFSIKVLSKITNRDPVEYLANIAAREGMGQDTFNRMVEKMQLS